MKVTAKCTARAWDSEAAQMFHPGVVYEIDHDGKLASLKVDESSRFVFEFDRAGATIAVQQQTTGAVIGRGKEAENAGING